LLVEVNDDLRVGVGAETVTGPNELLAQLAEVVDLAVQYDNDGAVLVVDRLVPAFQIDDRKALNAKRDPVIRKQPTRVRAAMLHGPAHALDDLRLDGALAREDPGDSAHASIL
jgi:hypothetical protein